MAADEPDRAPGHPEVERIVAPNPGPLTLDGTNTFVVAAAGAAYVIDPGPDDAGHLERVRAAAERRAPVAGVLLTHGHSDHGAGVKSLGLPLLWGAVGAGDEAAAIAAALPGRRDRPAIAEAVSAPPDAALAEPASVGPFEVMPTPGHAADHVCLVLGDVCFCGDLILGRGSSIVVPRAAAGSLVDYMDSLRRVAALDVSLLAPGHGPWITEPRARVAEYVAHRRDRERRLVAALDSGERSRAALLTAVWDDVPEALRPAAAVAMQAHVEKLAEEGRIDPAELTE